MLLQTFRRNDDRACDSHSTSSRKVKTGSEVTSGTLQTLLMMYLCVHALTGNFVTMCDICRSFSNHLSRLVSIICTYFRIFRDM
jgi:hypothetical protein